MIDSVDLDKVGQAIKILRGRAGKGGGFLYAAKAACGQAHKGIRFFLAHAAQLPDPHAQMPLFGPKPAGEGFGQAVHEYCRYTIRLGHGGDCSRCGQHRGS